ncbi:hypothetical protein E4U59_000815 [Claviceps monticola]|nr:hypothetical protein E4U59_000815 [Claviceps monticola]
MDDLASRFERLGGSWNIEKAKEWNQANAKCLSIMLDGLSSDDAVIIDEYETSAAVWAQLQKRYAKTSASSDESGSNKCYLCQSVKHLIADGLFQDASREHARNLRMAIEGKLYQGKPKNKASKSRRSKKDTKSRPVAGSTDVGMARSSSSSFIFVNDDCVSWNIEKAKEWNQANAKCLSIMLDGLSSDDAVIIDEYETAAAVWAQLQKRYAKTSASYAKLWRLARY